MLTIIEKQLLHFILRDIYHTDEGFASLGLDPMYDEILTGWYVALDKELAETPPLATVNRNTIPPASNTIVYGRTTIAPGLYLASGPLTVLDPPRIAHCEDCMVNGKLNKRFTLDKRGDYCCDTCGKNYGKDLRMVEGTHKVIKPIGKPTIALPNHVFLKMPYSELHSFVLNGRLFYSDDLPDGWKQVKRPYHLWL